MTEQTSKYLILSRSFIMGLNSPTFFVMREVVIDQLSISPTFLRQYSCANQVQA
jgi:hypothetical protein